MERGIPVSYNEKYYSIKQEWSKFINGDASIHHSTVRDTIFTSWNRCKSMGVDPYLKSIQYVLPEDELKILLKENESLINVCLPFMRSIYDLVYGSGFIVVLGNHDGYILEIVGDENIVLSVQRGNFIPGACWSEEKAGTNGLGTAIETGKSVQIFACEHFCRVAHRWTCSGSPIFDPAGKLVGVIDMTGPYDKAHPHTLGMVVAAARAIENELRARQALADSDMADKFKKTVISSIPEGLITIDNEGCISLINDNARKMFKVRSPDVLGRNLREIFLDSNDSITNAIRSQDSLIDSEIAIKMDGTTTSYTLTTNPILSSSNQVTGKIIILNELKRAKNLVTSMIGAKANFTFDDIIGADTKFVDTVKQAHMASLVNSNVLLLGESGTGKDVFSQAIHNNGSRRSGPYIAINCAAIPRDLIGSELFGYSEGAFTGSRRGGNPGKFELADGGTIFLDEIGETPLELQASLLRVIEDKTIMRIGGKHATRVDVRIIAATNKNLKEEVKKGLFRDDLYYRLNVFTISMVPLRERKDDIPVLLDYFMNKTGNSMGKKISKMDDLVLEKFLEYHWPGNIRELQNVIERMVNIAHSNVLTVPLIPLEIMQYRHPVSHAEEIVPPKEMERELIERMVRSNMPKREIARKLKIARSTLYRKLERYDFP
jgi:transcriptional regulator of acetoin/glycerol metabolism